VQTLTAGIKYDLGLRLAVRAGVHEGKCCLSGTCKEETIGGKSGRRTPGDQKLCSALTTADREVKGAARRGKKTQRRSTTARGEETRKGGKQHLYENDAVPSTATKRFIGVAEPHNFNKKSWENKKRKKNQKNKKCYMIRGKKKKRKMKREKARHSRASVQ